MTRRQLTILFLCSLIPWTLGNGLLPLLPVYLSQLGATPAIVGYYLAVAYLALALGTMAAGWLSDILESRRLLLLLSGAANVPMIWLAGQVKQAWQLTLLTALIWFFGGMCLTLIAILAGLGAGEHERGRIFGLLGLTSALGSLLGGLTTGALVDRWGYPAMFSVLAGFGALLPFLGGLLSEPSSAELRITRGRAPSGPLGSAFYWVLLASLASSVVGFVARLGTSLSMHQMGLNSAAVASTAAIGGLIALPLAPAAGWLSDRFNRLGLLMLCCLVEAAGLAVLAGAATLGAFWLATALQTAQVTVAGGLGSALITDLVPRQKLGRGLSALNTMGWVGGIAGFGLAGAAIQTFGMSTVFAAGAMLAVLASLPLALAWPRKDAGRQTEKAAEA